MASSQNQIFTLLLVLSFMWYMCHRHDTKSESEHFVVNNVMQVPPMVADNVYQYNNDLLYEESRGATPNLTLAENVETQRVPPVINPMQGQAVPGLISGVHNPPGQATRVPDDLSTNARYNIPTPQYDNAQGGVQNTNAPTPTRRRPVWNSKFIYN